MNKYKGKYVHSREYKNTEECQGKKLLVIGPETSGVGITIELGQRAKPIWFLKLFAHFREAVIMIYASVIKLANLSPEFQYTREFFIGPWTRELFYWGLQAFLISVFISQGI